jgi:16S rRNA (guanine966-N2)-methyltransferase
VIRVISGLAKGRKLRMVPGRGTRPISDRVKEALFNIIGVGVRETVWLDLFAGTGSVGIEALSRGAKLAMFIDNNRKAVETIIRNLEHTRLIDKAEVVKQDAFEFLKKQTKYIFDYVYIAPPQYENLWKKAVVMIDEYNRLLNKNAWVIAQIHPKERDEISLTSLIEFDQRRYGNTLLVFYKGLEVSLMS